MSWFDDLMGYVSFVAPNQRVDEKFKQYGRQQIEEALYGPEEIGEDSGENWEEVIEEDSPVSSDNWDGLYGLYDGEEGQEDYGPLYTEEEEEA